MDNSKEKSETPGNTWAHFFWHTLLGPFLALILTVMAWKMNTQIANLLLMLAWAIATFSLYSASPIRTKKLEPRVLWTVLLSIVLGATMYCLLWTPTKNAGDVPTNGAMHAIPYDDLLGQRDKANADAEFYKQKAVDFEKAITSVAASNTGVYSSAIQEAIDERDRAWTNSPTAQADLTLRREHTHEMRLLARLKDEAAAKEQLDSDLRQIYPIWAIAASKLKEKLSGPAREHNGIVISDDLPSVQEIVANRLADAVVTIGTNSAWKCRITFGENKKICWLDCTGETNPRTTMSIELSGDRLAVGLNSKYGDHNYLIAATNCLISSISDCDRILNDLLDELIEEQRPQF